MAKSFITDYDTTAANNTDIDGVDSTGTTGLVKNGDNYTRSIMAQLAKFYDDLGGVNTVAGTATAITVTAAEGWTAYGTGANQIGNGTLLTIKTGSDSAGATTLNVNGIGTKAIRRQGDVAIGTTDWVANTILQLRYDTAYNGAAGAWVVLASPIVTGTWTPALTFGGGSTGLTYGNRFGRWVKIGRMVFVDGFIILSAKGSSTGSAVIGGLPVTVSSSNNVPIQFTNWSNLTTTTMLFGTAAASATSININTTGTSAAAVTDTSFQNTTSFSFSGWYPE